MAKVSRRNALSSLVGMTASTALITASATADASEQLASTVDPDTITADKIANAATVAARVFSTDERNQAIKELTGTRKNIIAVRTATKPQGKAPAFQFQVSAAAPLPAAGIRVKPKAYRRTKGSPDNKTLARATVGQLAKWLRDGKTTSVALTELAITRCETYGPRLLCIVNMRAAAARREAIVADDELAKGIDRGPLHGIPYGIKDLFNTADIPTTYGAPPFRDQQFDADATVVKKLRDAGAILVAKLSLGELAMGDVWFGGTTRTPWDTSKGSSGSSAGSASAVAACLLPFAIGTETYGSITSHCTACGTTGLRPTFGRVSRAGAMALSWTMDKIGPITRSIDDAAIVFSAICGHDPEDRTTSNAGFRWDATSGIKGLKIGFDTGAFKRADKSQQAVLDFFKSQGADLIPVTIPASEPGFAALPDIIIGAEGAAAFSDLISDGRLPKLVQQDDWNWPNTFRIGSLIPAADYISAMQLRSQLQDRMDVALRGIDVYITPGLAMPNITWTNLTGHPTVITRCGMSDKGMPIMIEFTGNLWREDAALRAAYAWEQYRGSDHGWPEIDAAPMTPPALSKEG